MITLILQISALSLSKYIHTYIHTFNKFVHSWHLYMTCSILRSTYCTYIHAYTHFKFTCIHMYVCTYTLTWGRYDIVVEYETLWGDSEVNSLHFFHHYLFIYVFPVAKQYVCMYVCKYIYMYISMNIKLYVRMYVFTVMYVCRLGLIDFIDQLLCMYVYLKLTYLCTVCMRCMYITFANFR